MDDPGAHQDLNQLCPQPGSMAAPDQLITLTTVGDKRCRRSHAIFPARRAPAQDSALSSVQSPGPSSLIYNLRPFTRLRRYRCKENCRQLSKMTAEQFRIYYTHLRDFYVAVNIQHSTVLLVSSTTYETKHLDSTVL